MTIPENFLYPSPSLSLCFFVTESPPMLSLSLLLSLSISLTHPCRLTADVETGPGEDVTDAVVANQVVPGALP